MMSMALEAGDAAGWGSTAIALVSIFLTVHQASTQRQGLSRQNELQAEASQLQRRQIEAAERRAFAMEEMLARLSTGPSAPWDVVGATPSRGGPPGPPPPAGAPVPSAPGGPAPAPAVPPQQPAGGSYGAPQPPVYASPQPAHRTPGRARSAQPGSWDLRQTSRYGYTLRNISGRTLQRVRVSPKDLPQVVRNLPEDAVVRPGEAVEFLMAAGSGDRVPSSVWVTWEGQHTEVAVTVSRL